MWIFDSRTGKQYDPSGKLISQGYAGGNCGENKEGINNPDLQAAKCVGPLPIGLYTFGEPIEGSHLGRFAIPLIPDPLNNMYGRGSFFVHGDNPKCNQSASEGCNVQPFTTRQEMWNSGDHQLKVVDGYEFTI